MNVSNIQKNVIRETKKIVKKNYFFSNSLSYFPIFSNTPGTLLLKSLNDKKFILNFFLNYSKFFLSIFFSKVEFKKNFKKKICFKNIYFSWGFKNNFDKRGNFKDKYTNINISNFKNTLIFLLYLDDELPKKIKPNIVLVFKKKFFKNLNFFYFFNYFIKNLGTGFFKKMSSLDSLSDQIVNFVKKNVLIEGTKNVFIIYEGQPYQKNIIHYLKKKNKFLNVTGYDHSAPPALPLNLIFDGCSPDKLLITGKEQGIFYRKYLNWPRRRLKIIPSFRFRKEKKIFFKKRIFLPFELDNKNVFLKNFQILSDLNIIGDMKNFEVKIHPLGLKNKEHIEFSEKIKKIIEKKQNLKKDKFHNSTVFFGQTTAILVALELNFKCYHVCSYPIFDCYSSELWSAIKVKKLSNNLFMYKLRKKNSFLKKGLNIEKIF